MLKMAYYHFKPRFLSYFLVIILVLNNPSLTNSVEEMSMEIIFDKPQRWAADFTPFICGNFTIQGTGPENCVKLILLFNNESIHEVNGNSMEFRFNTNNYSSGKTNITIQAVDGTGGIIDEISKIRHFVPNLHLYGLWVAIGLIVFAIIGYIVIKSDISIHKFKRNKEKSEKDKFKIKKMF